MKRCTCRKIKSADETEAGMKMGRRTAYLPFPGSPGRYADSFLEDKAVFSVGWKASGGIKKQIIEAKRIWMVINICYLCPAKYFNN